jgi:hypothetical protein
MDPLELSYEKQEEIPQGFEALYTERGGKWQLTKVNGIQTTENITRLETAIAKERKDHKELKEKYSKFSGLDPDEVITKLDEYDELKLRVDSGKDGKLDEDKLQQLVEQRLQREKAPLQRELDKLKTELQEKDGKVTELSSSIRNGTIENELRKQAEKAKVHGSAIEDIVLLGKGIFDIDESGRLFTKEGAKGFTPGLEPDVWLSDMKEQRPHWWPQSQGGGAYGSKNPAGMADNPWSKAGWNKTAQGQVYKNQGAEKAGQMAKAAGVDIFAAQPAEK